jgi:hypothetical protein
VFDDAGSLAYNKLVARLTSEGFKETQRDDPARVSVKKTASLANLHEVGEFDLDSIQSGPAAYSNLPASP